jgi:hypothetical protein
MKSLGAIGVSSATLQPALQGLDTKLAAAEVHSGKVEAKAGSLVRKNGALATKWQMATKSRRNREQAMLELIESVSPQSAVELQDSFVQTRRLSSVVTSFKTLCRQLDAAQDRGTDPVLGNLAGGHQMDARVQMLKDINTVSRGIKAAGLCEAATTFPLAQLTSLREQIGVQVAKLEKSDLPAANPLLKASQVATTKAAAGAIANMLGEPAIGKALIAAEARAGDKDAFARDLGSMAMMLDQAGSAPDYSMTRMGWHYGYSRADYRARTHTQEPFVMYLAEQRLEATQEYTRDALLDVTDAKEPGKALQSALSKQFLTEIGVHKDKSADWKPSSEGISKLLKHEALVPLRGLNETVQDMGSRHKGQTAAFDKSVTDITKSMVEGGYKEWRTTNPASTRQLQSLNPAQRKAWLGTETNKTIDACHGGTLKTREEDDVDLLWLTKIGGPSHGFDFGGHCLLPLLSNARTRAVVVEDTKWPDNPAARAYLRLLENTDGEPVLYLEPLQRDFPHRDEFKNNDLDAFFIAALVDHAADKARQMGVPLSIDSRWGSITKFLELDTKADANPEMVLAASGGVLEASDTMTKLHDWVQTKDETIRPHDPRITYSPKEA